jgi:hypothetical protein
MMGMTTRVCLVEVDVDAGGGTAAMVEVEVGFGTTVKTSDEGSEMAGTGSKVCVTGASTVVDSGVSASGLMVTVTVSTPADTVIVAVFVIGSVMLLALEVPDVREPLDAEEVLDAPAELDAVDDPETLDPAELAAPEELALVDETTPPVADAVGTKAAGIVPKIRLASSTLVQPKITPSVVFMGSAKQALPASGQGMISKDSPPAQVPSPPATHAA